MKTYSILYSLEQTNGIGEFVGTMEAYLKIGKDWQIVECFEIRK